MPYVIGLTGNPGTGKSYVAKLLKLCGIKGWHADTITQQLLEQKNIKEGIQKAFPFVVTNKGVDKKKLLEALIKNPSHLRFLEEILHPFIRSDLEDFLKTRGAGELVWIEVPLLYEVGWDIYCNCVFLTHCHIDLMIQRLSRRGWSKDHINMIIQRYTAVHEKLRHNPILIETNGTKQETWQAVRKWLEKDRKL